MVKFLILILLTSLVTTAQTQQPVAETSKSGSITGKVVDERGEPLPHAKLSVSPVGANRPSAAAITDRDGTFRVDGMAPVPYQINVWMPGYVTQLSETSQSPHGTGRLKRRKINRNLSGQWVRPFLRMSGVIFL